MLSYYPYTGERSVSYIHAKLFVAEAQTKNAPVLSHRVYISDASFAKIAKANSPSRSASEYRHIYCAHFGESGRFILKPNSEDAKTQNTPLTWDHNYRDMEYSHKVVGRSTTKSREVSKPWDWVLTHWGRDKMAVISQTTFSGAFSWMKMYEFWLTFHWNLFSRVQLTIFQHWFR